MTKLIVGICLHTANAVLIQKFRIVSGIAIQEIVCAHTQPEELDLAVGVLGIVVHPRDIRRGKRAVAAQIGKLIEIAQTIRERLVSSTRETANRSVVSIVDGAIVLLYIRQQVVNQVETEDVLSKVRHGHLRGVWHRGQ